jgi:hypothetical protein
MQGLGAFGSDFYWSSSEYSSGSAWRQNFDSGTLFILTKHSSCRVRAVRAFNIE